MLDFKFTKITRTIQSEDTTNVISDDFILGTVTDFTKQYQLEQELRQEQEKRTSEMRKLFAVIHIDVETLSNFINDSEQEINAINDFLKSKTLSPKNIVNSLYLHVHSIKGNAQVLGLEDLAQNLHLLENKISKYKEIDPTFSNILDVTIDLSNITGELDSIKKLIYRLSHFKIPEDRLEDQEAYVIEKSLRRLVNENNLTNQSNAELDFNCSYPEGLKGEYRKVFTDILSQLVRNSLAHGIETKEERVRLGKKESGLISIKIYNSGNNIILDYQDDGQGLNIEQIKQKIKESNNLQHLDPDTMDENQLSRMILYPEFSTTKNPDMMSGRGIGMNIVNSLLKKYNGKIGITSKPGKGIFFRIQLPVKIKVM